MTEIHNLHVLRPVLRILGWDMVGYVTTVCLPHYHHLHEIAVQSLSSEGQVTLPLVTFGVCPRQLNVAIPAQMQTQDPNVPPHLRPTPIR